MVGQENLVALELEVDLQEPQDHRVVIADEDPFLGLAMAQDAIGAPARPTTADRRAVP